MIKNILKCSISTITAVLILSGCGGGSGNDNNSSMTDNSPMTNNTNNANDDNSSTATEQVTITPYQRIVSIPGTQADIQRVAVKIADYVVDTDEKTALGFPSNWVIAGANPHAGESYDGNDDLIPIPVDTGNGVYKSRVIEFCNGAYAKQAINTGQQHGSALPCEVAVHSDGKNVYVDALDADAIFTLFFPGIEDPDGKLRGMARAVNYEIRKMVTTSLESESGMQELTQNLGPVFTQDELSSIKDEDIYIVTKYQSEGKVFTKADAKTLAQTIIDKLGTPDQTADKNVAGLSNNSLWRSARPDPIAIPGVFVVEACSPTYAKMATKLGAEYLTALPCEITTYLDRSDDTNKTISVSILNPDFMFKQMFKGAVENAVKNQKLTQEEAAGYTTLAQTILEDLNKITNAAIADSGLGLSKK